MQKTKDEIIPHYKSHRGKQNQMRLENYPQCATQCATQWDSQNHMKRCNESLIFAYIWFWQKAESEDGATLEVCGLEQLEVLESVK